MDRKELEKRSYMLRRDLESRKRGFVYDNNVEQTYTKHYKYTSTDQRLLSFALDNTCMNSDVYILYAIAHMGVADKEGISMFLKALASHYPALNIVYEKTKDALESRLYTLVKIGYLFSYRYTIKSVINGVEAENVISLYTLIESGYDVVKQRLQKRLTVNTAIQYKTMNELIGWASAAYVGSCIAKSSRGFVNYLERVLRTKQLGSFYFPMELKTQVGENAYYVAIMSSYLYHNVMTQTRNDYEEFCAFKINALKNYLYCRTQKGTAITVVAVADNDDLMEISSLIYNTGLLNSYLDQIYFTGEGILKERDGDASHAFLRMRLDYEEDIGYRFEYSEPIFL